MILRCSQILMARATCTSVVSGEGSSRTGRAEVLLRDQLPIDISTTNPR
jgi:hypothetical protein